MERKYKKKFPKVTLYKYAYENCKEGAIITPIEVDITCKGFTIRGDEPCLDKSIKNEYIDHLFRHGDISHYVYTMYSLKKDEETLIGFLDRMVAVSKKEKEKAMNTYRKRLEIYDSVEEYRNSIVTGIIELF